MWGVGCVNRWGGGVWIVAGVETKSKRKESKARLIDVVNGAHSQSSLICFGGKQSRPMHIGTLQCEGTVGDSHSPQLVLRRRLVDE